MDTHKLNGKMVAILATNGFEESELFEPKTALEKAGVEITIVSLKNGEIKSWAKTNWGKSIEVDLLVDDATASDFDGLVLPGGVMNPDTLRTNDHAMNFVSEFAAAGKPIAAICHGPWALVETDVVRNLTVTSWPSLKTDLINAGANWVDREVVVDGNFITSRKPDDLPAFNRAILELLAQPYDQTAHKKSTSFIKDKIDVIKDKLHIH